MLTLKARSRLRRWPTHSKGELLAVIAVALVGVTALIAANAAASTANVQPENGTLAGTVTVVNDATASGGKAIQYGTATSGGGITFNRCTSPTYTLPTNPSNPQDGLTLSGFYVTNDTWNYSKYPQSLQTMYICNYNNWYVNMTLTDSANNGEIKTYPNVHKDFNNPAVSTFHTISSTFAHTAPPVGAWDVAYDVWFNGLSTELMIWTQSSGRQAHVPGIPTVGTVTLSGNTYTIHRSGSYIAYDMPSTKTSGTVNILEIMQDMVSRGFITNSTPVTQIDYGIELCDTAGTPVKFELNNFSLTTN
jgi:hypothetical protein